MIETTNLYTIETIAPIKPISLRDQVYAQLRLAILERRLKPGDHVREQELTKLLHVSRTPLREALGLAERDGLVQYFPNRGWFVTKFTPPEIQEIFVIRSGLENLAADLVIDHVTEDNLAELEAILQEQAQAIASGDAQWRSKIDMAFHQRIVEFANNKRLLQMWGNIAVQCSMVFNYHTVTLPDYDHWQGIRDHTAILDALRSGNAAAVHAVNNEINQRVAGQCIEGFLAVESRQA
jgi:GntR family transcriptional regulator, rspAB operon transcriptional repressor